PALGGQACAGGSNVVTKVRLRSGAGEVPGRRLRAHFAGVGLAVSLVHFLVIARGRQRDRGLLVAHGEKRRLASRQELLDENPIARRAEGAFPEEDLQRAVGLLLRLDDQHSLARAEPVPLADRPSPQLLPPVPPLPLT